MKKVSVLLGSLVVIANLGLLGSAVQAQSGKGPEAGPSPAAQGATPGPLGGKKTASWWGADVTPGWSLMTWTERNEHRKTMRSMKTYEECKAYLDEHHQKMTERAKEKGKEPMPEPKRDACAGLKS
ncbi:MAG: hypothetical protein RLZZ573_2217 [Pseudomonadota bacterium]